MGFHIDKDDLAAMAKRAQRIADAMPKSVGKAKNGADAASSGGNDGTAAAAALKGHFGTWAEQYDLLTRQVAGFATDLDNAVAQWSEIEDTNAEVFTKYGKDL